MSGVVLDVPAVPVKPSFFAVLVAVLAGYVGAAVTVVVLAWSARHGLGLLPQPFARHGAFPVDGVWSLAADVGAATLVVLVTAEWIRFATATAILAPVSFGVVVVAVTITGLIPFLTLRPVTFSISFVSVPVAAWIVRRYAIGTALPFPTVPRRIWAVLAVVAVAVFASFGVYHPLAVEPLSMGIDTRASGTLSFVVPLKNSGFADVTILRVHGGGAGLKLPYTLKARSQTDLGVFLKGCAPPDVTVTYSVLGLTSTQRLAAGSLSSCRR